MSLLWANHLTVWLSATHVAVVNQQTGLHKKVLAQNTANVPSAGHDIAAQWQAALSNLGAMLDSMQLAKNTRLTVSIASDFVRYLSLPAQHVDMRKDEKLAYAKAAYRELYGDQAAQWQVQCDDAPPHHPIITAAIDAEFLSAIKQLALQHALILFSVQPYLMTAMSRLCHKVGKESGYLAIIEQRLLLLNLNQGQYQSVKTYALDKDWQTDLSQIVARETLLSSNNHQQLLIYAPQHKQQTLVQLAGWKTNHIRLNKLPINANKGLAMLEVLA